MAKPKMKGKDLTAKSPAKIKGGKLTFNENVTLIRGADCGRAGTSNAGRRQRRSQATRRRPGQVHAIG
jgi:hypothetical protein